MITAKKEKYLQWKHELLSRCGQCLGFRAKGIDLSNSADVDYSSCEPGPDCHKTCPALGMGLKIEDAVKDNAEPEQENTEISYKAYEEQKCFKCSNGEDDAVLLPCRHGGKELWVCTKCLPGLIHG